MLSDLLSLYTFFILGQSFILSWKCYLNAWLGKWQQNKFKIIGNLFLFKLLICLHLFDIHRVKQTEWLMGYSGNIPNAILMTWKAEQRNEA